MKCPKFKCLSRTLKVVDIKGFKGTRHEVSFLCFLLFYGVVLQQLNITVSKEDGVNGELVEVYRERAQRLQSFPKASSSAQISVY